MKKKVFFVVGHSNWGKSFTLRKLTNDSFRTKRTEIDGLSFYIRRMSNDDNEDKLLDFAQNKIQRRGSYVIIAFCPAFEDGRRSKEILDILQKDYQLYFFILKHKFGGSEEISNQQINVLKQYGLCEVIMEKCEAELRAEYFKAFIKGNL